MDNMIDPSLRYEITELLLETKNVKSEEEKKSLQEKMFSKYYGALNKVSEKGARKLTPTADKLASKEGRFANNSDYDAYYKKYSSTKKKVKVGTLGATMLATAGVIPGVPTPMLAPIFAAGTKYSPDPEDEKLVNNAIDTFKKAVASVFKSKKESGVDANGAIVAANSVKDAVRKGSVPNKKDIRIFDNAANKINALMKQTSTHHVTESSRNFNDIKLLLEGVMLDYDLDNAIDTMSVIIEAYDFTNDEVNDMFAVAEATIDMRL